ncbi:MAG TPA: folylpolyglutamate synthase/dihydrofolate synthase family protein [Planctomycetota bacterium]|nr:folylpolyglutamate synthase/dihydrofolate synthase family protein [Planctomycetota bacterium]
MQQRFASYEEAIRYLFTLTNYEKGFNLKPRTTPKLGLERMAKLLEFVGNPESRLRAVHVAGTKGKGSTATMAASVLAAAGCRTGLYLSPHVEDVRERIQVDGRWIPQDAVCDHLNRMFDYLRRCEAKEDGLYSPTFFEAFTAIAFMHFGAEKLDFAVAEVGMGGRLDATNVLQPLVCGITPVSMDHMERLGNTLAEIAGEKAGIIKPGVPVVCGPQWPEALDVIRQRCAEQNAPLFVFNEDFGVESAPGGLRISTWAGSIDRVRLAMRGEHQAVNAATAAAMLAVLQDSGAVCLTADQIRDGLATAFCPARVELIRKHPATVVDAAHNPASVRALLETLRTEFRFDRLICVFAVARDKDVEGILRLIAERASHVIFTTMDNPRAATPDELAATMRKIGFAGVSVQHDHRLALGEAESLAHADDLICVCGSFYLAGDVRKTLKLKAEASAKK